MLRAAGLMDRESDAGAVNAQQRHKYSTVDNSKRIIIVHSIP
jgi:hypothetical protein